MKFIYKVIYSELARFQLYTKLKSKYPDCIPVICQYHNGAATFKFLVNENSTWGQFIHSVRQQIKIAEAEALYLFVNGEKLVLPSVEISTVYRKDKSSDGFLYVMIGRENVFG